MIHDVTHPASTILRTDDTFTFAYFQDHPELETFIEQAQPLVDTARASTGALEPGDDEDAVIHYSVLPWVAFTSFQHARRLGREDSVPKIVFGKERAVGVDAEGGVKRSMPVSVEVHHALVDGLHMGWFFERFQAALGERLGRRM